MNRAEPFASLNKFEPSLIINDLSLSFICCDRLRLNEPMFKLVLHVSLHRVELKHVVTQMSHARVLKRKLGTSPFPYLNKLSSSFVKLGSAHLHH